MFTKVQNENSKLKKKEVYVVKSNAVAGIEYANEDHNVLNGFFKEIKMEWTRQV